MTKFLSFFTFVLLVGCSTTLGEVEAPRDDYNELSESFEENIELPIVQDPCAEVSSPSLQELICNPSQGHSFTIEYVEANIAAYTRYAVKYNSDGLWVSGVLLIPTGEGPFPLVVTNHGYIDTGVYTRGRGLKREQDALARAGFAVLHPDYRNHAASDEDPDNNLSFRLGYVEDVIGGITAIQNSELPEIAVLDANRVGMIGHSMGGGVSMQVAVVLPDLIDALVLYAPVSALAEENLQRYFLRREQRSEVVEQLFATYGSPEEAPEFWQGLSPFSLFDRIQVPVQIYIGTADDSVEPSWSYAIRDELQRLGKHVELIEYEGAPHEFIKNFADFSKGFVDFFLQEL